MEYTFEIDELIAKQLTGESTASEEAQLEKWLAESPDNQHYFTQMHRLWQQSDKGKTTLPRTLDTEAALARTKSKIERQATVNPHKTVPFSAWWMAAAAALALLMGAVWFFQSDAGNTPVVLAAAEQPLTDTLTDGSVVSVNQHSAVFATFSKKDRRVKMRGEAYFEVAPNATKPFVIDVQQVQVTVVGTKFNIDNRRDTTIVVVSVEEGKVKVQVGSEIVYLIAGEQATIDCELGKILRSTLPPAGNIKGWFDRRFVFDDVQLSEVLPILEHAYDVQIELENKVLEKCRLRTHFEDEPIEHVMEVIAETFSLQLTFKNGRYSLDGTGCGQ